MTFCQCGCGGEIIIKPRHKYYGVPKYIKGHHCKSPINKIEDVWKRINKKGENDCWLWLGSGDGKYGQMKIKGKYYGVHRLVYELFNEKIPDGLFVCHKCNNPKCCNPKHLYVGTQMINQKQMVEDGRSLRGEKHSQSKLKEKDILEIRRLYSTGDYYQTDLGKLFGVGGDTISLIIKNKIWKHVGIL